MNLIESDWGVTSVGEALLPLEIIISACVEEKGGIEFNWKGECKMPASPVRKRVNDKYWEDGDKHFISYMQRHMIKKDTDFDDPANCGAPRQHSGETYGVVTTTHTKYKYGDASSDTETVVQQFIDLFLAARNAGGFTAPKDQNGVARETAEVAYYKNRALEALAVNLTAQYNTQHGTNFVFANFVTQGFVCPLPCF